MGRADFEGRAKLLGMWDLGTGIALVENANSFLEFILKSFFQWLLISQRDPKSQFPESDAVSSVLE